MRIIINYCFYFLANVHSALVVRASLLTHEEAKPAVCGTSYLN